MAGHNHSDDHDHGDHDNHDHAPDHDAHDHSGHGHSGHAHGPGGHHHAPTDFGRAFAIGIGLNTAFVIIEASYGVISNSMALLADAGHNMSDVLGLAVAWIAAVLSRRAPSARYTYGLRGSSILAAVFNATFLLVAVGAIGWEAIQRLFNPEPVAETTVMIVAAVGILINGITAYLFAGGRRGDLNIRGAYLHMASDAVISAGVVVAGLIVLLTGWTWLDPAASLVIVALITWGTWSLLRDSVDMALAAVPAGVKSDDVRERLSRRPGVARVHDLHIWSMSTTEIALTAHLVMPDGSPGDAFLADIARDLRERFGIVHCTLQVEADETACSLAPEHVV